MTTSPQAPQSQQSPQAQESEVLRWRKVQPIQSRPELTSRRSLSIKSEPSVAPVVAAAAFQETTSKPQQPPRSSLLIQQPPAPTINQQTAPPLGLNLPPVPQPKVAQPPAELAPAELPPVDQPEASVLQAAEPQANPLEVAPARPLAIPTVPRKLPEPPERVQPPESVLPDPSTALPNPFPKSAEPQEALRSPSDRTVQEPAKLDDDLPPLPPKRANQSVANCDVVRNFAAGADIRNFRLDSSPEFVQVYQSADRPGTLTKENFVTKSPFRTWRGEQGEYIAEGKLVDYVYGTVVLEQSDGKRVSYLQRKLSDADQVFVSEAWGVPVTCPLGDQGFAPRFFVDSTFTWKASGACNKPLYFEDVALERYGHEWGPVITPVVSTVRFFGDLAVLPYKMGIHPPNECQHPLGYYRPGTCAPWSIGPVPLSMRGAVTQAAFVTGTAFALP